MRSNRNISARQDSTLKSAEIVSFWQSQGVDYQYSFPCKNLSYFTGKEKDSETGFYYFGARYYDPALSCLFLSVDPMADKYTSLSPYAYCAWKPLKLVDPDGKDTINLADSKFLRTQPDISNALIINAHGNCSPPAIHNNNIEYIDDFSVKTTDCIYASRLASYISETNVYQENNSNGIITPIFLLACQTGESTIPYQSFASGIEQTVPNSLVIAPIGDIHAKNGLMRLLPKDGESYHCYWSVLYKGQDIGHIENYEAFNISTLMSSLQKTVEVYNTNHPDNQIQLPELSLQ